VIAGQGWNGNPWSGGGFAANRNPLAPVVFCCMPIAVSLLRDHFIVRLRLELGCDGSDVDGSFLPGPSTSAGALGPWADRPPWLGRNYDGAMGVHRLKTRGEGLKIMDTR